MALIDTGAQISCISENFLKYAIPKPNRKYQHANFTRVLGVGGESHKILGTILLDILIENSKFTQKFHVFKQLQHPVILGDDFLELNKGKIDIGSRTLFLNNGTLQVNSFSKPVHSLVRTRSSLSIDPGHEKLVPVKVSKVQNQVMLIEPVQSFSKTSPLLVARVVVTVLDKKAFCRILNPTDKVINIQPGKIIGSASPIDENNISELQDPAPKVATVSEQNSKDSSDNKFLQDEYIKIAKDLGIDIENEKLENGQKEQLLELIGRYRSVFAKDASELGCAKGFVHKIDTGDAKPQTQQPYRKSPKIAQFEGEHIEEMLKANIVEESISPWQSPVVLVKKKTPGEYRFAVDYRKLNKYTEPESFPVPQLESILDTIAASEAKFFSTLDLASGFWQIPMDPDSQQKTAFITQTGKYEFKRMPFGLMNAPTTYQRMMTNVLKGLNWKILLVYMDDIIIFSSTFDEHIVHLEQVFKRLAEFNLTLKPSKCKFASEKVLYLGHVISEKGIEVNPSKVEVIESFPIPHNTKKVREFLGMCNYYRKFIKGYSQVAAPMYALLKADATFEWTKECDQCFNKLKKALVNPPVLAHPKMNEPFILSTDASTSGIGYILSQTDTNSLEHPILYGGRSLRKHEKNYPVTELECLAVVEGILKFHIYLADNEFKVYTDHKALTGLMNTRPERGRLHRWATILQGYKMNLQYRPGKKMANADAISRRDFDEPVNGNIPEVIDEKTVLTSIPQSTIIKSYQEITIEYENDSPEVNFVTVTPINEPSVMSMSPSDIAKDQAIDLDLKDMYTYLNSGTLPTNSEKSKRVLADSDNYCLDNGVLFHLHTNRAKRLPKYQRVVKQLAIPCHLRPEILYAYHDSLLGGGHQGYERTLESMRSKYYWPKMPTQIQDYINSCDICQKSKRTYGQGRPPLTSMPIDNRFDRWHMDFIGPINPPGTDGSKHLLVMVDSFSRWCEAIPMKTQEASEVADAIYANIICRYGAPRKLVSDRGKNFLSKIVQSLSQLFNIRRSHTSSYHPQTNSACERLNGYIETQLKAYVAKNPSTWNRFIPGILMNYRKTPAMQSTGYSPYFLLFGSEMNCPIDTNLQPDNSLPKNIKQYIEEIIRTHSEAEQTAKKNIEESQARNKHYYDRNAKIPDFKVGDRVLLKNPRTIKGVSPKLQRASHDDVYTIVDEGQNFTYKITNSKTHKTRAGMINANRLRRFNDPRDSLTPRSREDEQLRHNAVQVQINPPPLDNSAIPANAELPQIKKILKASKQNGEYQYRVQFENRSRLPEWRNAIDIPPKMREDFHINRTLQGRRKKKRKTHR